MNNTLRARKAAHKARQEVLRERKRLRKVRAPIHAAMEQAIKMKRSRKKGTSSLDTNMLSLGWCRVTSNGQKCPVEVKFKPIAEVDHV